MAQDNVVKRPAMMSTPDNTAGNESGVSTTAGMGTTSGKVSTGVEYNVDDFNQFNDKSTPNINIDYSHENRSAKWKNGEAITRKQDIPDAGRNQYQ